MAQPRSAFALRIFGLGLTILAVGLTIWLLTRPEPGNNRPVTASGEVLIGGPFELVDQQGQTRRDSDFRGRHMLVYFGYTYCPDICPTSLMAMTQALDILGRADSGLAEEVVPLFITIDPERDTVQALAAYAPNFHANLVALTGTAEQVAAAAEAYRVYYAKAETGEASEYLMDHSSFIYLMDPEGRYLAHFPHSATAESIAKSLKAHIGS